MHKFRIVGGAENADCRIEMDGKPMQGVTSVTLNLSSRRHELTLVLRGEVEIEGALQQVDILRGHSALDQLRTYAGTDIDGYAE